ncbi:uncharacterized protein CLUP02_17366 [Colletotrichum lupini]|uniref:Uncharacterized protein n=1 Tax=Colletotrichum lupini TaxID=145971 RepID=A0A9Q8SG31_9PEZI|nr:uncharacterized protein CLUP02_17366 [Colletotrichum lupini]UQC75857.1 hypothetical protein CLUP02_17366 [Colletotrichum lupini]
MVRRVGGNVEDGKIETFNGTRDRHEASMVYGYLGMVKATPTGEAGKRTDDGQVEWGEWVTDTGSGEHDAEPNPKGTSNVQSVPTGTWKASLLTGRGRPRMLELEPSAGPQGNLRNLVVAAKISPKLLVLHQSEPVSAVRLCLSATLAAACRGTYVLHPSGPSLPSPQIQIPWVALPLHFRLAFLGYLPNTPPT